MRAKTPFAADSGSPAALLLELCGVLYDDSCWRRWMLQLLTRMGVQTHYAAFFQVWEQEHFSRVCAGEVGYWEAMRQYLCCIGLPGGRVDEACAAGQSRRRQWERVIRPLPGVVRTLEGSTAYQAGDYIVDNDGSGRDMYAVTAEKFLSMYDRVEE